MNWHKRGKIFAASGQFDWMQSHTQVPCVLPSGDRLRVYFATRPSCGMSLVGFVDLDIDDPGRILHLHDKPVLDWGAPGAFDEHGIMPNHVFRHAGQVYLFYVGWSRRQGVPYSNWTGMAVSDDDGVTFRKVAKGPILDRTRDEIYSATCLTCLEHEDRWRGWYATGTRWLQIDGRWEHTYELRACSSDNLLDWTRPNQPIFPNRLTNESSTRPTVLLANGCWHMWFCYRGTQDFRDGGDSYRIGYAWSRDIETWTREDDKAGIAPSAGGWDALMTAYPCVVKVSDRVLMFYSGNGFGRAGFGYAELDDPSGL